MSIFTHLVAMLLAVSTPTAEAHDGGPSNSSARTRFEIKFSDLDLNSEHDAEIVLRRIEQAARKACGGHPSFSTYTGGLDDTFYECREAAIRQAVTQLRAPLVERLYREAGRRGS